MPSQRFPKHWPSIAPMLACLTLSLTTQACHQTMRCQEADQCCLDARRALVCDGNELVLKTLAQCSYNRQCERPPSDEICDSSEKAQFCYNTQTLLLCQEGKWKSYNCPYCKDDRCQALPRCQKDEDCPQSHRCQASYCLPLQEAPIPCHSTSCAEGFSCNALGHCVPSCSNDSFQARCLDSRHLQRCQNGQVEVLTCDENRICAEGSCLSIDCEGKKLACSEDGLEILICREGQLGRLKSCEADQRCDSQFDPPRCIGSCENGQLDDHEVNIDCGGERCPACRSCVEHKSCTTKERCLGGSCQPPCQEDKDCRGERSLCRSDGLCTSEYFALLIEIPELPESNVDLEAWHSFRLPLQPTDDCQIEVDWGRKQEDPNQIEEDAFDGEAIDCSQESATVHRYEVPGLYLIRIKGSFQFAQPDFGNIKHCSDIPDIYKQNFIQKEGLQSKMKALKSFGKAQLGPAAFFGVAADFRLPENEAPLAQSWTDATALFACSQINDPKIRAWNSQNLLSTARMFFMATAFNQDIQHWNVSKISNMAEMFFGASKFNQPLAQWDTSEVTMMNGMFANAIAFNQELNTWNISKVANLDSMFSGATSFNQPLDHWKTDAVTTMNNMFSGATSFNQPLGNWKLSNVDEMRLAFAGATSFNQSLKEWNLKANVVLNDIFKNSGLDKEHYCELKSLPVWKDQWSSLGQPKANLSCE